MSKLDSETTSSGRKRQLNVIYFIDSSRTHTLTVSLWQLRLALGILLALLLWSAASVALVASLEGDRNSLTERLQIALATVFDYETRVDNVFEIAYPPQSKSAAPAGDQKPSGNTSSGPNNDKLTGSPADSSNPNNVANLKPIVSEPELKSAAEPRTKEPPVPVDLEEEDAIVAIGRPVLLTHPNTLELKFDLTTKPGVDFAEGYIFAIAEFSSDQGEKLFIGAPREITVSDKGVPMQPLRATSFAIKRFKQKGLKFPLIPNKSGTFTKVHIAVIGSKGEAISSYDLPVKLHIGKQGWEKGPSKIGGASKSG